MSCWCDEGGGVYVENANNVTFRRVTFLENIGIFGGSIAITKSTGVNISDSVFIDNLAYVAGGAVYLDTLNDNIETKSCKFLTNIASSGGNNECTIYVMAMFVSR